MGANQTYCGDHFAICTNIQSPCCTPESNIMFTMLYINYTSIKINEYNFKFALELDYFFIC